MDFIEINGISSETVNVWIDTPPMPPKAKLKTQNIVIPGREDVITSNGEYEDIPLSITAYVFERDYDPAALYEWMEKANAIKTSISNKYYYKVKKVHEVSPQYAGHGKYKLALNFTCDPYKYNSDNPVWTTGGDEINVRNNGTAVSRPLFVITGSGDIGIETNSDKVTVKNVSNKAYIDCQRLVCYDDSNHILASSGRFPELKVGFNTINIYGNVTTTQFQINERWL